ncbi:tRNA-dihydrouridine synthase family protein [Candidatus Micrarchaeota archaeon]|nr:tRNA-dihydrouridine synthase family protein [Candidatus Micrarchaeota archaeon]
MLLAPMDGFTDTAFRILCQKCKAEYCYTEMISVSGFVRKIPKALEKAYIPKEDKSGLQFFGSDPDEFKKAVKMMEESELSPKSIDLNLGCPVQKVAVIGAGSALIGKPKKVEKIVNELTKSNLPISVKMRLGRKNHEWKKILRILNNFNLQHLTVHLRTAEQMYSGNANWDILEKIVSSSTNPIIANGDIKNFEDAKKLIERGAKNVMIGRAALTNPYVFSGETNNHKKAQKFIKEYMRTAKKYKCFDETQFKRIKMKLLHGFEGAKELRKQL